LLSRAYAFRFSSKDCFEIPIKKRYAGLTSGNGGGYHADQNRTALVSFRHTLALRDRSEDTAIPGKASASLPFQQSRNDPGWTGELDLDQFSQSSVPKAPFIVIGE
jgi:hypothetical protein